MTLTAAREIVAYAAQHGAGRRFTMDETVKALAVLTLEADIRLDLTLKERIGAVPLDAPITPAVAHDLPPTT